MARVITTRLAGRNWLEASADRSEDFTALPATVEPPPLTELDHILADVLSDRFGLPSDQGQKTLASRTFGPGGPAGTAAS
jgi:hypothetical protein